MNKKIIEEARDVLLKVCETNAEMQQFRSDADLNWSEAKDEFNDMYDLIDLLFANILEE